MKVSKVVVVGAGGGIGRYLTAYFDGVPYQRGSKYQVLEEAETIIYCAAKAHFETPQAQLFQSIEDNFLLLERVSRLPHKQFVFFSSVDVYPKNDYVHLESEEIKIEDISSGYPSFKLMCEAVVRERCNLPLILRPTSLFGPGMRPNNIIHVLGGVQEKVTLNAASSFNCITYDMVAQLIDVALKKNVTGTLNCAATGRASLAEVAELGGYSGGFGPHEYQAPRVSNEAVTALIPAFGRTSLQVLKEVSQNMREWE